jgi:hypothetical protein
MLPHHPQLPITRTGARVAAKRRAGATRLVLDIREASLAARLAASVKLARQEKEAK